ncbi:hypothetical protein BDP27DRAFT_1297974 [Rhodocollybia butyracea]|uniref:DUF7918 domain-containing protein n=1 Tax=Rhodocollybia butyracea TaxID=206335 RepID=A0A9P5PMA5_9AGAR|nr:hypothetical protein BDP27DRAFT_1297974 [Rhodocollybia butyracea]
MLQIGPYSAWLVVDGARLETHSTVAYHNRITTSAVGWVSSEAGKKFSVLWHNAVRDIALEAVVSIDGIECNRHIMLDAFEFPDKADTVRVSYTRTSEYTRRDFLFSVVQVTDDDEYLSTVDHSKFGTITLDLWRLQVKRVARQTLVHEHQYRLPEPQVVHERSKMGGRHHVKFGEEYQSPLPTVDMVDARRMDRDPYVSFTFKYRPQDMLRAQGVIERQTKPCYNGTIQHHLIHRRVRVGRCGEQEPRSRCQKSEHERTVVKTEREP